MKKTMLCSPMKQSQGTRGTRKVSSTPDKPQSTRDARTTAIKALPVKMFWLMLYVPGNTNPSTTKFTTISHDTAIIGLRFTLCITPCHSLPR